MGSNYCAACAKAFK